MGWVTFWTIFFKNSSGHPGLNQQLQRVTFAFARVLKPWNVLSVWINSHLIFNA
jgi:hypothetical protein